jgi:predicted acetyltransferase
MLQRDEAWWRDRVLQDKQPLIAVHYDEAGQAAGYVIYQVRERHCRVKEMAFVDEAARRELWKFLANHDSMLEKLTLPAPADDRLVFLLEHKKVKQELKCIFMYRIVDVAGFVQRYRWAASCGGESRFVLRVEDRYAPWNDGEFEVAIDGAGRASVEARADRWLVGGDGAADAGERDSGGVGARDEGQEWPVIACSIQTLTALLFGYQPADWLREIGRLECSDAALALLEDRVPRRAAFIMDSF